MLTMSKANLSSGDLPYGHCQYSFPCTKIRRRISKSEHGRTAPSSQVLLVCVGNEVYLCKVGCKVPVSVSDGAMAMDHHAEMVLRWNPAVKITTTNSNQVQDVIKSLVRCQAVLPVSTFTEFGEKTGSQHWARLLPVEEPQNVGTKFVATFPELPTIPLSVVFRRRPVVLNGSSEPLKPLQLSSIKRQMAGLYMLFRDGVVTTNVSINLTDASYDMYVESVCCQLLSSVSSYIARLTQIRFRAND